MEETQNKIKKEINSLQKAIDYKQSCIQATICDYYNKRWIIETSNEIEEAQEQITLLKKMLS